MNQQRFGLILTGVVLFWVAASVAFDPAKSRPDFAHDYAAGLMIRTGHPEMMFSAQDDFLMPRSVHDILKARAYNGPYVTRFYSHPFYALLMVPFSALSYPWAVSLFVGLELALWAMWLWAVFKRDGPWHFLVAGFVCLLFYPFRAGTDVGQITVGLVPLVGYFVLKPEKTLAVLGLALSFLVKPLALAVVLLFFFQRKWKALALFAGAWTAATALAWLIVGSDVMLMYIRLVLDRASHIFIYADMQSSLAVLYRIIHGTGLQLELEAGRVSVPLAVKLAFYAWAGLVLAGVIYGVKSQRSAFYRANLLAIASLLVIPFAAGDYFSLALVPLAGMMRLKMRPVSYWLAATGFVLLNLPRSHWIADPWFRVLCFHMFAGTLLIFVAYLIHPARIRLSLGRFAK